MSNTTMLSSTCNIACGCTSLPGEPNGMIHLPSRLAIAGLGVNRGRLPGARHAGCAGSVQDCMPRDDGAIPVPGITGVFKAPSLGGAENALPCRSMTHTNDVSGSGSAYALSALAPGNTRTVMPSSAG